MHPERRLIGEFHDQRRRDHDEAADEDREHRGPVARIGKSIIEAARLAARSELQESLKQMAPAAARTATGKPGQDRKGKRTVGVAGHEVERPSGSSEAAIRNL